MEIDHITPQHENGPSNIENAIAVCFECHAEIHSYNDKHPRGRKFQPEELRKHKQQWLDLCKSHPELLTRGSTQTGVGPLQALIDELEFNFIVADQSLSSATAKQFIFEEQHNPTDEGDGVSITLAKSTAVTVTGSTLAGPSTLAGKSIIQ